MRNIASIILGLTVGGLVVHFIDMFNYELLTISINEESLYENDPAVISEFTANLPTKALFALLCSRMAGVFVGSFLSNLLAGMRRFIPALSTGVILSCLYGIEVISLPHATWYSITVVALSIPVAFLSHKLYLTIVTVPR